MGRKRRSERQEEVGRQLPAISEGGAAGHSFGTQVADVSNSFGNDGDQSNLSGHRETNAEAKALEAVELGGPMASERMIYRM